MIGSEDAPLRRAAVTALGTSDEPEIGALMLQKLGDSRLFDLERVQLLTELLGRSRTRGASLTWLEGKLWMGDERADRTLWRAAAAAPACTVEDAVTVERLVKPATRDPRRELTLGRQLERIRDCAALKTSRGEQLAEILQSFRDTQRLKAWGLSSVHEGGYKFGRGWSVASNSVTTAAPRALPVANH
jgi:hypothetical protein